MKRSIYFSLSLILSVAQVKSIAAQEFLGVFGHHTSQMTSGGIGLIQTPTARMGREGDMFFNYSDIEQYRFWSVNLQLFPWMESTIRYTDVRSRLFSNEFEFSGDQTLKDKGIDVKFRLFEETRYIPETAIGFRDFGGTGFFESEFVGVSKKFGDFDINLGIGWGYLGTSGNVTNPICRLSSEFCNRPEGFSGRGGSIEFGHFFKGPAAFFGGIEYQTPWDFLRVKLEYEGNDYSNDQDQSIVQQSAWNLAATYSYNDFDFSLSYIRGNTFGLSMNYKFNLHDLRQKKLSSPPREVNQDRRNFPVSNIDGPELVKNLYNEAGFVTKSSALNDEQFTIYGTQVAYRDHDESIQRVARVLIDTLPNDIDRIKIVENVNDLPMLETQIDVPLFIQAANYERLETDIRESYVRSDTSEDTLNEYKPVSTSGFYSNLESYWAQTFGSPEKFYFYQGGLIYSTGYVFNEHFSIEANLEATLIDNYEDFNFTQDNEVASLPRVRTQIREYVSQNSVSLDSLFAHWQNRIAPNWYAQVYAGYLETMFGGFGAEFLYQPVNSNFSYGFDINYVQQRDFENYLDFLDYEALTGHVNMYWQPEFLNDIHVTFNIGQFLAKDRGINIDLEKRFDSGITVGVYAAITNVSAEEYGEGSFTKGFYITIPFDLFTTRPSKGGGYIPWAPIARDGGQMLNRPSQLHTQTNMRGTFYR